MNSTLLITTGTLSRTALADKVAIVTGSGNGIGFEAARALVWLGAKVFIAEIDKIAGRAAAEKINAENGEEKAIFLRTDIGDEGSVEHLRFEALRRFGRVDVVLNNATVTPLGAVKDILTKDWDRSYRVNLRGPTLLARAFIPEMLERNYGVFVCVSSFGGAYMAAYESFKRAQAVVASTLAEELVGTDVIAFTIEPGQARTQTMEESIKILAPLYGKTPEEYVALNQNALLSVEAAGAGFAAAIALAPMFRGQETSSLQALQAAGIKVNQDYGKETEFTLSAEQIDEALFICRDVYKTLAEQAEGWKRRPVFERKWIINDFNRNTGMPVEKWLEHLDKMGQALEANDIKSPALLQVPIRKIALYWKYQGELSRGYTKNPDELKKQLEILGRWQKTAEKLADVLKR